MRQRDVDYGAPMSKAVVVALEVAVCFWIGIMFWYAVMA